MAVFPVWRSPIISSLCPRPMGTKESMDFRPVCSGWCTLTLSTTPGAWASMGRFFAVLMGPLPSMGCPKGFTTRPIRPPYGYLHNGACAFHRVTFFDMFIGPRMTTPMLSSSRLRTIPKRPPETPAALRLALFPAHKHGQFHPHHQYRTKILQLEFVSNSSI